MSQNPSPGQKKSPSFVGYHPRSPYLIPPTSAYDYYNDPMATVDFLEGDMEQEVVAQVTFRNLMNSGFQDSPGKPRKIPFYVCAGLGPFMESLSEWGFTDRQLDMMAEEKIPGTDKPLVPPEMIKYLRDPEKQRLRVSISAREEGSLAFPHEPLMIIKGPKWQVDMIEAAADNIIKNHTKWATIATEFWLAAESPSGRRPSLIDGSLRRASDWPALGPARSSYIAGWDGSSNKFAKEVYGVPALGSGHPHSFYMAAGDELTANRKWLRHLPPNSLPDSRNTLEGMDIHLQACKEFGISPRVARNDSDDPEWFIKTYSEKMRAQGFDPAKVNFIGSNSWNAMEIYEAIHVKDLPYGAFIIGTHIGNHVQDPTEATVQKLAQVTGIVDGRRVADPRDMMKIAKGKSSWPGVQDTIHLYEARPGQPDLFRGSVIVPAGMRLGANGRLDRELISMPNPRDGERPEEGAQPFLPGTKFINPNVEVMRDGKPLLQEYIDQDSFRATQKAREHFFEAMASLDPQHKRLIRPIPIGFGVEESLFWRQSREIMNERLRTRRNQERMKMDMEAA